MESFFFLYPYWSVSLYAYWVFLHLCYICRRLSMLSHRVDCLWTTVWGCGWRWGFRLLLIAFSSCPVRTTLWVIRGETLADWHMVVMNYAWPRDVMYALKKSVGSDNDVTALQGEVRQQRRKGWWDARLRWNWIEVAFYGWHRSRKKKQTAEQHVGMLKEKVKYIFAHIFLQYMSLILHIYSSYYLSTHSQVLELHQNSIPTVWHHSIFVRKSEITYCRSPTLTQW